jgi:hypothetical protein
MDTVVCPECGEGYSKNGLYGHLMGHGFGGEELEEIYQEALGAGDDSGSEDGDISGSLPEFDRQGDDLETADPETKKPGRDEGMEPLADLPGPPSEERSREEREPSTTGADEVQRAADRLRRAKERLKVAEEKTGNKREEKVTKGGVISRLLGRTETRETVERTEAEEELCRECREEVAEAERELQRALKRRQAEHEYGETE